MAKEPKNDLARTIEVAIDDHVAAVEDPKGFSKLDVLLATLRDGQTPNDLMEVSLLQILPKVQPAGERAWEALRLIVEAATIKSAKLSTAVMRILDQQGEPTDGLARFQAFLVVRALGGALVRRRLDEERALYSEHRPLWVDLVISSLKGMPDHIVAFLEQQASQGAPQFTWRDIIRRLPFLFRLLGDDFNRAIVRITHAIPNAAGKAKLAEIVNKSFNINPLVEQNPSLEDQQAPQKRFGRLSRLTRAAERGPHASRSMDRVFKDVLSAGMSNLKHQKNIQAAYGIHP
ncbi:hypothetical protein ACVWW6_001317 [Bradyrhizobium sp. USDA 3311]